MFRSPQPAHAAYAVVADFLGEHEQPRPADAIIAFGGRDMRVADHAARLYQKGWAPWVVTTGGVLFDGERSEAEAFADHMIAVGVPAERILVESRSRHTGENARYALDLLDGRTRDSGAVIAVPWPFAARRAAATLRRQAPWLDIVSAPDRSGPDGRRIFGPRAARAALAELDRLDRYAEAGFIEPQHIPPRVRSAGAVLAAELEAALETASATVPAA